MTHSQAAHRVGQCTRSAYRAIQKQQYKWNKNKKWGGYNRLKSILHSYRLQIVRHLLVYVHSRSQCMYLFPLSLLLRPRSRVDFVVLSESTYEKYHMCIFSIWLSINHFTENNNNYIHDSLTPLVYTVTPLCTKYNNNNNINNNTCMSICPF